MLAACVGLLVGTLGCDGGGDGSGGTDPITPPVAERIEGDRSPAVGTDESYRALLSAGSDAATGWSWSPAPDSTTGSEGSTAWYRFTSASAVTLRATPRNDGGTGITASLDLTPVQPNLAPAFTDLVPQSTPIVGVPLELEAVASDPEAAQLSFSFGNVTGASADSINGDRYFVTPSQQDFTVEGTVSDGVNTTAYSESFTAGAQSMQLSLDFTEYDWRESDRRGADMTRTIHLINGTDTTTFSGTGGIDVTVPRAQYDLAMEMADGRIPLDLIVSDDAVERCQTIGADRGTVSVPSRETFTGTVFSAVDGEAEQGGIPWQAYVENFGLNLNGLSDPVKLYVAITPRGDQDLTTAVIMGARTEAVEGYETRAWADPQETRTSFQTYVSDDTAMADRSLCAEQVPGHNLVFIEEGQDATVNNQYIREVTGNPATPRGADDVQLFMRSSFNSEAPNFQKDSSVWYISNNSSRLRELSARTILSEEAMRGSHGETTDGAVCFFGHAEGSGGTCTEGGNGYAPNGRFTETMTQDMEAGLAWHLDFATPAKVNGHEVYLTHPNAGNTGGFGSSSASSTASSMQLQDVTGSVTGMLALDEQMHRVAFAYGYSIVHE